MAQILKLDQASGYRAIRDQAAPRAQHGDDYSFWPEVACGLWSKSPHVVDPQNSPRRVLSEMMLIVGVAALLVLIATAFLGTPSL